MYSGDDHRHVCMLPQQPPCLSYTPTAGLCKHIACCLRRMALAAEWHSGTATFLRSQKSLAVERERQINGPWFILHPYSPIKFYWDCFKMTVILVCFVYAPLQVFINCPSPYDWLILFCDAVAFLDMLTNFVTGCVDVRIDAVERRIVLKPRTIAVLYLKDRFLWDLISTLPLQLIQPFPYDCIYTTHTAFLILKILRMKTFCRAWKNLCHQIGMSYIATRATTVVFRLMLIMHWLTYLQDQVPSVCIFLYEDSPAMIAWIEMLDMNNAKASVVERYITNLYRIFSILVGTEVYDPTQVRLIEDMMLVALVGIIGLFFLAHTVTALLRLVVYHHYEMLLYGGRQKELQEYLNFKRLPRSLQHKVQLFIGYKYNGHYFKDKHIINTINEQIKQDINMFSCKHLVSAVPLFRELPVALINTIIFGLTQVLYMPGEMIVKCGNPGKSLYLIASGTVAVMNSAGREVAHLKDGACFGERALLQPGVRRSVTIVALEITEIYKLTSSQFQTCLQPCPRLKRRLQEALQSRTLRRTKQQVSGSSSADHSFSHSSDFTDPPSKASI